jgi:serine/threonine protein phosphatase 1
VDVLVATCFAIGDVHGCAKELNELLEQLPLRSGDTVVFVGDYVDRGEDSRGVIDILLDLKKRYNVVALKGNHEEMLLEFLAYPASERAAQFIFNGGSSTLASYADEAGVYEIPQSHIQFLNELPAWYVHGDYVFVHAGLPLLPIEKISPEEHEQEMLWIRGDFLRSDYKWSKLVIHGHTPVPAAELLANRINLDTGCVFGRQLTAIELPSKTLYQVQRKPVVERVLLRDKNSKRRAVRFDGAIPIEVHVNGRSFRYETLNYSELGLLMREHPDDHSSPELHTGERVRGVILPGSESPVLFQGQVVRRRQNLDGLYYAVAFLVTSSP